LGLSLFELRKYQESVARFTGAIEIDPSVAVYYNNRGLAYYKLQEFQKSLDDFSEALQRDPEDGNTYFNRGNTFLAMKVCYDM
jgi:tetratricopeptide (TPR) repeat protein